MLERTEVRIVRIGEVDLQFAIDEGEGFGSLEDWRSGHERFWASYWGPVDGDTLVVADRFRVV